MACGSTAQSVVNFFFATYFLVEPVFYASRQLISKTGTSAIGFLLVFPAHMNAGTWLQRFLFFILISRTKLFGWCLCEQQEENGIVEF